MRDLTHGSVTKTLIAFSMPMLLGNLLQQLYSTVDSLIVGRFVGKQALAAVGISFPVTFLLTAAIIGFSMGVTILVAQYKGAKKMAEVRDIISTSFIFFIMAALLLTAVGFLVSGGILRLIQTPEEVFDGARLYLNIVFAGNLFTFGYNGVSSVYRGVGDSKTPLLLIAVATVINIGLDLLFVVVFKWAIAGAAIATVIAQAFSFLFGAYLLIHRDKLLIIRRRLKDMWHKRLLAQSLKLGLPIGIQQTVISLGVFIVNAQVNTFGVDAAAASNACTRINNFAMLPAMNIQTAMSSFTGQNLAAGQTRRVRRGLRSGMLINLGIAFVISAVCLLFGRSIVSLFSDDPGVLAEGHLMISISAYFYMVFAAMLSLQGILQGSGDTTFSAAITITTNVVLRIPFALLLAKPYGLAGVWVSTHIGWCLGLILCIIRYASGRWKNKLVVHAQAPVEDTTQCEEAL